jgi:uncharacterized membrane protein YdjX (TVP38/TMEM64 family)
MNQKDNTKVWIRTVLLIILVVAAGAALWYWREPVWKFFQNQTRVQEWIQSFGPWAPLISIALNAAQVLAAPIPGQIIGLANGYLYGIWMGTLYSMIGLVIGRTIAMIVGRWFGRQLVERLVPPEKLARWDALIHNKGPFYIFLIFLFPLLPDDIVCFLIGLTRLSIPHMLVLSALGGLPGVWVSCWAGANASELPWWAWLILGAGGLGLALIFRHYESQLEAAMVNLVERVSAKRHQPKNQK